MHIEDRLQASEPLGHAQDRRHADAPGQEQRPSAHALEMEMIFRLTAPERIETVPVPEMSEARYGEQCATDILAGASPMTRPPSLDILK